MILLDGKKIAADIKEEIALEVRNLKDNGKKTPHLAAIIVGNNGASITYVNAKVKACERVGFESTLIRLTEEASEEELLNEIAILNVDKDIDGFIFHPTNVGKMALNLPTFISATPFGILELLERYHVETSGKHVVVLGRSHIVGSPMSILLSQKRKVGNATVTMCHSRTKNLKEITLQADIIIAAIGIPEFLKADMVKENVTVIDVGITRVGDSSKKSGYRLLGDVAFEEVAKKADFITPVPGGVGPMTIAMLLKNTLLACERANG